MELYSAREVSATEVHRNPPLKRTPIAPRAWPGRSYGEMPVQDAPRPRVRWGASAGLRRAILMGLILTQTAIAVSYMVTVLPYGGGDALEIAIIALFAVLFAWISGGFWTAMAGFAIHVFGADKFLASRRAERNAPVPEHARTAIVMPICNEDVARVFAGLRATCESLARTPYADRFDFFVLSDSTDAEVRSAEREACARLCRAFEGAARIYYRWRRHRIKRKSGNIADFCRRWGACYRYMIVLDADSVMSGECIARLVQLMEADPNAGIIQTAPVAAGRDTLHARMQQFATRVYGPLFTAGLHFWQLGEAHYWGHNAIIRLAPFMRHCALARLPGRGPLSGEVLSHDFVEAALMRRAGWGVWIAYDLPGSYEEVPSNLIEELGRDRRWCEGNLINFRLAFMRGIVPAHRGVFLSGVMAYLSAPLWFAMLVLSTALIAVHAWGEPRYFVDFYQLYPHWPSWRPERAVALLGSIAVLLLLPKLIAVLLVTLRGAAGYGGAGRLALSALLEMGLSTLLAPVRMLFHTEFIVRSLIGSRVRWKSPSRADTETRMGEALRRHGFHALFGCAWAAFLHLLGGGLLWMLPVLLGLALSPAISAHLSRASLGARAREGGLFLIPEESWPPRELRSVTAHASVVRDRHAASHPAAYVPGQEAAQTL